MTKQEAEQKIKEKLCDIVKIYKEYEPNGTSLHMAFVKESVICFNNHWAGAKPIDFMEEIKSEVE